MCTRARFFCTALCDRSLQKTTKPIGQHLPGPWMSFLFWVLSYMITGHFPKKGRTSRFHEQNRLAQKASHRSRKGGWHFSWHCSSRRGPRACIAVGYFQFSFGWWLLVLRLLQFRANFLHAVIARRGFSVFFFSSTVLSETASALIGLF